MVGHSYATFGMVGDYFFYDIGMSCGSYGFPNSYWDWDRGVYHVKDLQDIDLETNEYGTLLHIYFKHSVSDMDYKRFYVEDYECRPDYYDVLAHNIKVGIEKYKHKTTCVDDLSYSYLFFGGLLAFITIVWLCYYLFT